MPISRYYKKEVFVMENSKVTRIGNKYLVVKQNMITPNPDHLKKETDDSDYIVCILPGGQLDASSIDLIDLKTTLPLETAYWQTDAESLLAYAQRFDLPIPRGIGRTPPQFSKSYNDNAVEGFTLRDGTTIMRLLKLDDFRKYLSDVKAAVLLWEALATENYQIVRETVSVSDKKISIGVTDATRFKLDDLNSEKECIDAYEAGNDDRAAIYIAGHILAKFVNQGLELFPMPLSIEMDSNPLKGQPISYIEKISIPSQMSYIWTFLEVDLCNKGKKKWPYKRCEDCGKWEDISAPGRRSTWARCDDCLAVLRKNKAVNGRDN
jgi:hypothetical protein